MRGVSYLMIEKISNTFEGVELIINFESFNHIAPELIEKMMSPDTIDSLLQIELEKPDSSTSISFNQTVETIKDKVTNLLKLRIMITPQSNNAFKLKVKPRHFNLFGGILSLLGQ